MLSSPLGPSRSTMVVFSHDVDSGVAPGSRRRKISRSVTASVPAARLCAPDGNRMAATRSARALNSRRAVGLPASMVCRDVSTATRPPERVSSSDLTMKWLWSARRCAL